MSAVRTMAFAGIAVAFAGSASADPGDWSRKTVKPKLPVAAGAAAAAVAPVATTAAETSVDKAVVATAPAAPSTAGASPAAGGRPANPSASIAAVASGSVDRAPRPISATSAPVKTTVPKIVGDVVDAPASTTAKKVVKKASKQKAVKKPKAGGTETAAVPAKKAKSATAGDAMASRRKDWPPTESTSLADWFNGNSVGGTANGVVASDDVASDEETTGKGKKALKPVSVAAISSAPSSGSDFWGSDPDLSQDLSIGTPTLSKSNIDRLKGAIARYEKIVAGGGWPRVPVLQMGPGTTSEAVEILRKRLEIEGDVDGGASFFGGANFDLSLIQGVKRFQQRNGLKPTGDLLDKDLSKNGTRTLTALNVPAASRLQQLKTNLARLQSQTKTGKRYVVVNIPAQEIEAVDGERVELRLTGVVGKPDRPSPLLSSAINQLKFNPTWTVPPTVLKEDLVPKGRELARKNQNVLVKFGIDAYGASGEKIDPAKINWASEAAYNYRYTQQPGKDNPLGFVKIDFPNPHAVYMHDTPSPRLFEKSYRAASSGCIRVQHVERLAHWLLRANQDWTFERVNSMKESGETMNVSLKQPVALYWVYITAWASEDGTVNFRRDLYSLDVKAGVDKLAASY